MHAELVALGFDPTTAPAAFAADYGAHSMRRTQATLVHRRTKNLRVVPLLLGHATLESMGRGLGIEVGDALEIDEQTVICGGFGREAGRGQREDNWVARSTSASWAAFFSRYRRWLSASSHRRRLQTGCSRSSRARRSLLSTCCCPSPPRNGRSKPAVHSTEQWHTTSFAVRCERELEPLQLTAQSNTEEFGIARRRSLDGVQQRMI